MASGGSSPREGRKRKKKSDGSVRGKSKSRSADASQVQADIDRFTSSGHNALKRKDYVEAINCFKRAYKAATETKETKAHRACAFNLGAAYVEAGKPQKGLEYLQKAQPGEKKERVADLQYNLGVAHEALEDRAQASTHYFQAAQLYRAQGDGSTEGDTCMKLALCHLHLKDWSQAAQVYQRAAESYRVAGRLDSAALALKEASTHMLESDSFTSDDVISMLSQCLELSVSIKQPDTLGKLYNELGLNFSQLKMFAEAAECYEQALPLVRSKPRRLAVVLQNLGAVHNTLGQYQQALDFHREAAALHGSQGSRRAQGRCFSNLGFAHTQLGELEEAGESYLHALQAFKDTDDCMGQWQACEGLGEIRLQHREPDRATVYYKQALGMLSKCKDSDGAVQERLVNKLSEALQLKLSLQQRAPPPRRGGPPDHNHRRQPRRVPDGSGGEPSQGRPVRRDRLNDHKAQNGFVVGPAVSASGPDVDQRPHGEAVIIHAPAHSHPGAPHSTQQDYLAVHTDANRNLNNTYEQADTDSQDLPKAEESTETQPSDHIEAIHQTTVDKNELSVVQSVPGDSATSRSAFPALVRLKSRFCSVM
ncbi:tetratricopeptide repeat protein 24 [Engraulis encrasicolus]|uniref:tetratricopeptide repeat protein 24 n=1 Tax=Engraulis encrasicolus TaxID=184585 RepID=UPI002FD6538C